MEALAFRVPHLGSEMAELLIVGRSPMLEAPLAQQVSLQLGPVRCSATTAHTWIWHVAVGASCSKDPPTPFTLPSCDGCEGAKHAVLWLSHPQGTRFLEDCQAEYGTERTCAQTDSNWAIAGITA